MLMSASAFATGIGISFYFGPVYAAICCAYYPLMFSILFCLTKAVKKAAIAKMTILKQMGGVVEETLSSIKLVTSFNQEKKEVDKFVAFAEKTRLVVQKSEKL
jgi:ABC-type multidrug transport system fused ATPase/permease subunit